MGRCEGEDSQNTITKELKNILDLIYESELWNGPISILVEEYMQGSTKYSDLLANVEGTMTIGRCDKEVALVRESLIEAQANKKTDVKKEAILQGQLAVVFHFSLFILGSLVYYFFFLSSRKRY
ncbi:hypothetical protein MLD38_000152 [Melastoma candidum]|uniref:Uncharacterized protein n=1 Tax=Melastoma candidum TaxID=119954 RepID=A0ACB9S976_9MYRT|nr:hypothetical protein MLD38_000152 [Melastoma candidum]